MSKTAIIYETLMSPQFADWYMGEFTEHALGKNQAKSKEKMEAAITRYFRKLYVAVEGETPKAATKPARKKNVVNVRVQTPAPTSPPATPPSAPVAVIVEAPAPVVVTTSAPVIPEPAPAVATTPAPAGESSSLDTV